MLAVMFNSLLILMPVIGARAVANAYDDRGMSESAADALRLATGRMLSDLAQTGPRDEDRKLPYWQDRIAAELAGHDMAAVRGYLLAAPEMLGREAGEQIRLRAEADRGGTMDERLTRAALHKLPEPIALRIETTGRFRPPGGGAAASAPGEPADSDAEAGLPSPETAGTGEEDAAPLAAEPDAPQVIAAGGMIAEQERRFQLLGSFADLANQSQRWLDGDRSDELVVKLTGLGLVQIDHSDGLSESAALAVSILKSAQRSQRLTPAFTDYLTARADAALPDEALIEALTEAFSGLATSEQRAERVRAAYVETTQHARLDELEADLQQIQRIAMRTSPNGTLTILSVVEDGADLRRARLLTEAGGERLIVLVRERGRDALRAADASISWNRNMVLEIMTLTAAGMLLFWLMLSVVRTYIRLPKPKPEPQGTVPDAS
ncbi:hypothetical protein [Hyphomonas sp.]|uniref:hypothetical protein n=1 Tax=Hyphomonas sp. TaxID=87 RepID=UPI00391C926E